MSEKGLEGELTHVNKFHCSCFLKLSHVLLMLMLLMLMLMLLEVLML